MPSLCNHSPYVTIYPADISKTSCLRLSPYSTGITTHNLFLQEELTTTVAELGLWPETRTVQNTGLNN